MGFGVAVRPSALDANGLHSLPLHAHAHSSRTSTSAAFCFHLLRPARGTHGSWLISSCTRLEPKQPSPSTSCLRYLVVQNPEVLGRLHFCGGDCSVLHSCVLGVRLGLVTDAMHGATCCERPGGRRGDEGRRCRRRACSERARRVECGARGCCGELQQPAGAHAREQQAEHACHLRFTSKHWQVQAIELACYVALLQRPLDNRIVTPNHRDAKPSGVSPPAMQNATNSSGTTLTSVVPSSALWATCNLAAPTASMHVPVWLCMSIPIGYVSYTRYYLPSAAYEYPIVSA